ncbi:MAG: hypothetical protein AAF968_04680 [Pseudomonadota bacterium]
MIDVDLGSAQSAELLFLTGFPAEATGLATFSISAGTSAGSADVAFINALTESTYGFDPRRGQAAVVFPSALSARHWRVTLTQTGGTYLQIGRLFLSPVLPVSVNVGYPFGARAIDPSRKITGQARQVFTYREKLRRELSFTYDATGATADDVFDVLGGELDDTVGTHSPIVMIPDREAGNAPWDIRKAVYGYLSDLGVPQAQGFNQYGRTYRLLEAG